MKFIVKVHGDSPAYTNVMESLITRSLTHSKDHKGAIVEIEVQGSVNDFKHFQSMEQGRESQIAVIETI
jgi:hypothetical protein